MKNYSKTAMVAFAAIALSLISSTQAFSQTPADTVTQMLKIAKQYQLGIYRDVDAQKAYLIYSDLARKKSLHALYELGKIYRNGEGTVQNDAYAIGCFQEAADIGYAPAICELALTYQKAYGVQQDFKKAYDLYNQAAQQGFAGGYYGAGYLMYKGFGVEQSYKKAMDYFQKGADMGDARCEYMIGCYYLEGYDNNQDVAKGEQYLQRALAHGHPLVKAIVKENVVDTLKNIYKKDPNGWSDVKNGRIKHLFRYAKNNTTPEQLTGTWTGKVYTFDWAGKKIEKEENVKLTIEAAADTLALQWFATDTLGYYAEKKDSCWVPPVGRQFDYKSPVRWFIYCTRYEMVKQGKDDFLFANFQTYNLDTREPRKPMEAVLQQGTLNSDMNNAATSPDSVAVAPIVITKVYPNPFQNKISVDYTLTVAQKVTAEIYDTMGNKYVSASPVNGVKGKNTQTLTVTLPHGDYTLYLKGAGYICSQIIMAK